MVKKQFSLSVMACFSVLLFAGCVSNDFSKLTTSEISGEAPKDSTICDGKRSPATSSPERTQISDAFKPTYIAPGEDSFNYAYTIYRSSDKKPSGVYIYHGVVFVIVNIDTQTENIRYLKGTALLRSKDLLRSHFKLPEKYKLSCREIECRNYKKDHIFRYVTAYRESDIKEFFMK